MRLSIVIPAYNEEQAIGSTIERCLAARETIIDGGGVDAVEIIVVSDGSTDGTARIAGGYGEVRLIVFERNRGYGAAIKRGFEESTGELVGFLDADGTCDPCFFATLCEAVVDEEASVALGSRLGPDSKMPRVRRLGNRIYAVILSALSNRVVTDTASGMRVLRRDVLEQLYPLPDGLDFTPAMSARALMDDGLTIVERPMPYEERVGESKLRIVQDGLGFLRIILQMTMMWRPAKLFVITATVSLMIMALLAMHPIEAWLRAGRIREDMIYRLLFCSLLGAMGVVLLSAGVLCENLHRLMHKLNQPRTFLGSLLDRAFTLRGLAGVSLPVVCAVSWLVGPGVWTRVMDGYVEVHWSRVVLAGLIVFGAGQMLITVLILNLIRFHAARGSVSSIERSAKSASRQAERAYVAPAQDQARQGARSPAEKPVIERERVMQDSF